MVQSKPRKIHEVALKIEEKTEALNELYSSF